MQVAWLDKIDRRYSWLKRALVKFDEDFQGTFPSEWHVEERISEEFCRITKYDFEMFSYILWLRPPLQSSVATHTHVYLFLWKDPLTNQQLNLLGYCEDQLS